MSHAAVLSDAEDRINRLVAMRTHAVLPGPYLQNLIAAAVVMFEQQGNPLPLADVALVVLSMLDVNAETVEHTAQQIRTDEGRQPAPIVPATRSQLTH